MPTIIENIYFALTRACYKKGHSQIWEWPFYRTAYDTYILLKPLKNRLSGFPQLF